MTDEAPNFPDWQHPAIRGDVLRALIYMRSCTLDLWAASHALQRGDIVAFEGHMKSMAKNDTEVAALIDDLSGLPRDG